jgi:hypothetical protein
MFLPSTAGEAVKLAGATPEASAIVCTESA